MVVLMTLDSVFVEFKSIGHFAEGLIITLGYFQVFITQNSFFTLIKIYL